MRVQHAQALLVIDRLLPDADRPLQVDADTLERFSALMDTAVHPTAGLFALLAHLEAAGYPRAVATSSRRAYAERLLRGHKLVERFAFVRSTTVRPPAGTSSRAKP